MKLTLTNIKKMKTNSTPLQKRVINYIVDEWSNYDDNINSNKITFVIMNYIKLLIYYQVFLQYFEKNCEMQNVCNRQDEDVVVQNLR